MIDNEPDIDLDDAHVVYLTPGNERPGWCDACLKPSLVTVDVLAFGDDGLSVIAEEAVCQDCSTNGGPQPEG